MISLKGKNNTKVSIITDSISSINNKRICTFEIELPRFIWAEMLTHRVFSRNASSSRAIPIKKKIKLILTNLAYPLYWGKNKRGMQSEEVLNPTRSKIADWIWKVASISACFFGWVLSKLGVHKQWAGRLFEPFETMKVIMTTTEFENFFELRDHKDAQPEIRHVAELMIECMGQHKPMKLNPNEWHLPYIQTKRDKNGKIMYMLDDNKLSLKDAKKISVSCCAQVSYRLLNTEKDKAIDIYKKLIEAKPIHFSPAEHQATPMEIFDKNKCPINFQPGETHVDKYGNMWSGNFCGWIQNRQLIMLTEYK